MKFKVSGSNRDTGARMVLEFEAESKAAAERKALQQGMSVNRVEDVSDGHVGHASAPDERAGRRAAGGGKLIRLLIVIAIVVVIWLFWGQIRGMIGR